MARLNAEDLKRDKDGNILVHVNEMIDQVKRELSGEPASDQADPQTADTSVAVPARPVVQIVLVVTIVHGSCKVLC